MKWTKLASLAWPFAVLVVFSGFAIAHRLAEKSSLTPLSVAIELGDGAEVHRLLETGANPNRIIVVSDGGNVPRLSQFSPVQYACYCYVKTVSASESENATQSRQSAIIKDLVKHGAKLNQIRNSRARGYLYSAPDMGSELAYAVYGRCPKLFDLLVELGADPKLPCRAGPTLFFPMDDEWNWLDDGSLFTIYEKLKKAGVDINKRDGLGKTALHYAAALRFSERCTYLIKLGADVNVKDKIGMTPLDCAKTKASYELLVAAGAKHGDKL